jgi:methylenetetrahydrofolate reductase (NADPH)
MHLSQFYAAGRRPAISFEVFPPKTDAAWEHLRRVLPEQVALRPDFMTATYGALGSTRERTLEIATIIRHEFGVESACHLTCVGSCRADLDAQVEAIVRAGIENIVALRGDPPRGDASFVPAPDGYAHANELVAHIRHFETSRGLRPFGIAVAGYPEKHIEAPDAATDLAHLKRKVETGANVVVTQLFYDNADFFRFVEAARAIGITVPIVPGLLPIVSARQVLRITAMCGARIPAPLQAELEQAGDDDLAAEQIGIGQCIAQATELLRHGVPGIHFYVLNRSAHMTQIMAALSTVRAGR